MDMSEEREYFIEGVGRGYGVEIHGVGGYQEYGEEIVYENASMGMIANSGEWVWPQRERDFWELGEGVHAHFNRQMKNGPMESISEF